MLDTLSDGIKYITDFFASIWNFFVDFFVNIASALLAVFSGIFDFIYQIFSNFYVIVFTLVGFILFYFFQPLFLKIFSFLSSYIGSIFLVFIVFLVFNLAGSIIAFTLYHIYISLVLAVSPFVTSFTTQLISLGFTGLLMLAVGIIGYKIFSK